MNYIKLIIKKNKLLNKYNLLMNVKKNKLKGGNNDLLINDIILNSCYILKEIFVLKENENILCIIIDILDHIINEIEKKEKKEILDISYINIYEYIEHIEVSQSTYFLKNNMYDFLKTQTQEINYINFVIDYFIFIVCLYRNIKKKQK